MAIGTSAYHNIVTVALPAPLSLQVSPMYPVFSNTPDIQNSDALLNYALGGSALPPVTRVGDFYVMHFIQSSGVAGIIYGAEWSPNFLPGSWKPMADTGLGNDHVFSLPATDLPRVFMRLRVTKP